MLTCLILAFAQPYLPPASGEIREVQTVIYLDDSYSMQARGKSGILLRRSIQDLLESIPKDEAFDLFTNEEEYRGINVSNLREKLQDKDFSGRQLSWKDIGLKSQNLFRNPGKSQKNFIAISDFQNLQDSVAVIPGEVNTFLVRLEAENISNVTLDSAWASNRGMEETVIQVTFSAVGDVREEISLGLYSGSHMLARKTVRLNEDLTGTTEFNTNSRSIPYGRIEIEDNGLQFDNRLYFSINETSPVKVVVIGDVEAGFLNRIYSKPEFDLQIFPESNIDYNLLSQANLVILNQPKKIPFSMVTNLQQLVEQQVFLVIIPSEEASREDYNVLLKNLNLPTLGPENSSEKLITNITFEHPLYRNVFDERVTNFEYPRVQNSFSVPNNTGSILRYQNGQAFLLEKNNVFLFTASLQNANSNFKNSPLIVPTFYNIGNHAVSLPQLYYELGSTQEITLKANLQKDEIIKLTSSQTTFIPQQQSFQNKVVITLNDLPEQPGHYRILQDSTVLRTLSFNVSRSESTPVEVNLEPQNNISVHSSIPDVFSKIRSANEADSLWKWFIIFTLFFLLIEMLILKFFK